jgi:hypothetical protein
METLHMTTIECIAGDTLIDVLTDAVAKAPARFTFNDWTFETRVGETLGDARQRFKDEHGFEVLTNEQSQQRAADRLEAMRHKAAEEIKAAKVMTEAELRDAKSPWPRDMKELEAYITSLVDRPHDYGTCVYAMSLAAVAAFNYVAHKLGTTGFQSGCADMDILRRTRGWEWGRIMDYSQLLYPQYCNGREFPSSVTLLNDEKIRPRLRELAKQKIAEGGDVHGAVAAHWQRLASDHVFVEADL